MKTLSELTKLSSAIHLYDLELEVAPDEEIKVGDVLSRGNTKFLISAITRGSDKTIVKLYHMNSASAPIEKIPIGTEIIFTAKQE